MSAAGSTLWDPAVPIPTSGGAPRLRDVGFRHRIRDGVRPGEAATTPADLAYPYAVEHAGSLYVAYSVGRPGNTRNSLELAVVPVSALVR